MSDPRDLRQAITFERWWDRLLQGLPPDAASEINPGLAAFARRVHALEEPPPVDATFKQQLWEDLMSTSSLSVTLPTRPLGLNGSAPAPTPPRAPRPIERPYPRQGRLSTGLSFLATAALIAVVLGLVFYVYSNQHRVVFPPAQETPTPTATAAADWPVAQGGNAARNRNMTGPAPSGAPVLLWQYPLPGTTSIGSFPNFGTAADGVLYLSGGDGLVAVDTATGEELWSTSEVTGPEAIDGDGIILRGRSSTGGGFDLVRINRAEGRIVWRAEEGRITGGSPVVADGVGYMPSGSELVAFDPATGSVLWRTPLAAPATGAAVVDGLAVLGDQSGTVYGVETGGGDIVWTYAVDARTIGTPSIANGMVYFTALDGPTVAFVALDVATGEFRWSVPTPSGEPFNNAAINDTTVFVTNEDATLYAFDAATGAPRWTFSTGADAANHPVLVGDTVFLTGLDDFLHAIDAETGVERWRFPTGGRSYFGPVIVDGVAYVATLAGGISAIGGSEAATPAATTPTPEISPTPSAASAGPPVVEFVWATSGSATEPMSAPLVVRLAPDGKLWVADVSNRFFIFDLDGNLIEVWGEPGTGPGQFDFSSPSYNTADIIFLPDGSFFVVDALNARIQQFDQNRVFIREWGGNGGGDGQFLLPSSLAVEPDGNLLVTDGLRSDIQRFTADGTFLGRFDATGTPGGRLEGAGSIQIDSAGRIVVAEPNGNRVRILDRDGSEVAVLGAGDPAVGGLTFPFDFDIDERGYVHLLDNVRVVVFDADGRFVYAWGQAGDFDGGFVGAGAITVNRGGAVYVADPVANRLQKFKITGSFPPPAEATPIA